MLLILVAFTAGEFRCLLAQDLIQKHGSGVFLPVHGSRSIQPLPLLKYRAPISLRRKLIKPTSKIILVKVSCLYLIYFNNNDEVILDQNLNARLKKVPQERHGSRI
jgi:hypothetical protein